MVLILLPSVLQSQLSSSAGICGALSMPGALLEKRQAVPLGPNRVECIKQIKAQPGEHAAGEGG